MDQLFEKFGLNLNLILAQMLSFGILVGVLYKLAYKPILRILDQRKDRIENSLKQAKEIEEKNEKLNDDITQKLNEAKKEAKAIVAEAKEIGEKARNEILVESNKEIVAMMDRAKKDISREKETMMTDIKDYIVKVSLIIVEKIIADKLDEKTKERFVLETLKELPKEPVSNEN